MWQLFKWLLENFSKTRKRHIRVPRRFHTIPPTDPSEIPKLASSTKGINLYCQTFSVAKGRQAWNHVKEDRKSLFKDLSTRTEQDRGKRSDILLSRKDGALVRSSGYDNKSMQRYWDKIQALLFQATQYENYQEGVNR